MTKTHNNYLNTKRLNILKLAKDIIAKEGLTSNTFDTIASKHKINISVFINPSVETISDETVDDWEGCLSIPGMSGLVRRHKRIKYSAIDLNGNNITGEVEGLHARVIQHEFDHLNGILYTSRLAHKNAFGYSEEIEKFWKKHHDKNS